MFLGQTSYFVLFFAYSLFLPGIVPNTKRGQQNRLFTRDAALGNVLGPHRIATSRSGSGRGGAGIEVVPSAKDSGAKKKKEQRQTQKHRAYVLIQNVHTCIPLLF